nr:MAG TPA: Single stranded DNA binding protein [Caudoviricetes sp.]
MAQIISGTILEVLEVKQGTSKSGNAWQKQAFAITTGGMFPDTIAFELFGDRIGQFGHLLQKDGIVTVEYHPRSHRWQNPKTGEVNYLTSLPVLNMYPAAAAAQQGQPMAQPQQPYQQPAPQAYQQPAAVPAAPAPAPAAAPAAAPELPF